MPLFLRFVARRSIAALSVCICVTCTMLVGSIGVASASANTDGVISLFAGTGTQGPATPGPATSSDIGTVQSVAVDSAGDVYVTDDSNSEVEEITPGGTLSVIAGTGTSGPATPGLATSSDLGYPAGVAVDSAGNVYIADNANGVVEKVTPAGELSVIAGTGTLGPATPGPATSSDLNGPTGVFVDGQGDLYIADSNNQQVYKVTPAGLLSIFAGTGTYGSPTAGLATSSDLNIPSGVLAAPNGDVYIADYGNALVEKVTPDGTLSIVAGTGSQGYPTAGPATSSQLGDPQGLAMDIRGNLYIADHNDVSEVSPDGMLTVVAGNTSYGSPTYGGLATATPLNVPSGVAVTPAGRIYIADAFNYTVDVVASPSPASTAPPTISGTTSGQTLTATTGAWTESPEIYSYQWEDCDSSGADCSLISGATASTYTPTDSDIGHTIRVIVTAENGGGSASQTSTASPLVAATTSTSTTTTSPSPSPGPAPVRPPAPSSCLTPSGQLSGTHLGLISLGMTRATAQQTITPSKALNSFTDDLCLAGGYGIRVGYATQAMTASTRLANRLKGRIVFASSANPYYSLRGARPGMRIAAIPASLHREPAIKIGPNTWYVTTGHGETDVIKARDGLVQEVGILNHHMTTTRAGQIQLLRNF